MLGFPPHPKHILLNKEQEDLLNWVNDSLKKCSRELYQNPADAPAIGQKYWDLLVTSKRIYFTQIPEGPWFPGGLGALFRRQIQSEEAIVVYNPGAIENYPNYEVYVPIVVVKPKLDQGVVTSRVGKTNYIELEPLQNLHALIFPEHPDEKNPEGKTYYLQRRLPI